MPRSRRIALAILTCGAFPPASALAQTHSRAATAIPAAEPAATRADRTSKPPRAQRLVIQEGDTVEGGRASPGGGVVSSLRKTARPSLIRPRADFLLEMIATALDY